MELEKISICDLIKYLTILLLAFSGSALADVNSVGNKIIASHRYIMGDNDSKSDATALCFLEAKRQAIEYAGVMVESKMTIKKNNQGSIEASSDLKAIASALVEAKQISSNLGIDKGQMYIDCEVEASVDRSQIEKQITQIAKDPKIKADVIAQQKRIKALEEQVSNMKGLLDTLPRNEAVKLRQERIVNFQEIDELSQRKIIIMKKVDKLSNDVVKLIEIGMIHEEVESLMGDPRSVSGSDDDQDYNYGKYWVNFNDGVVKCIAPQSMICHEAVKE